MKKVIKGGKEEMKKKYNRTLRGPWTSRGPIGKPEHFQPISESQAMCILWICWLKQYGKQNNLDFNNFAELCNRYIKKLKQEKMVI